MFKKINTKYKISAAFTLKCKDSVVIFWVKITFQCQSTSKSTLLYLDGQKECN